MRIGRIEITLQPKIKKESIENRLNYLEAYPLSNKIMSIEESITDRIKSNNNLTMVLQNENELRFQKIEKAIKMLTEISEKLSNGNK